MAHDPNRTDDELEFSASRLFKDDTKFAVRRIAAFRYLTTGIFLFFVIAYWALQVRDHETNSELAARNRIKTILVPAARGRMLDRDGKVIVDNQPSYAARLMRENLKPEHLAPIAKALGLSLEDLQARVAEYASSPKYRPIPIKQDLTEADLAFMESHKDADTFPELDLIQIPRRLYPKDGMAAHVVGYVGQVNDTELNSAEFARYSQGDIIGKQGLERQYNDLLTGVDGERRVEVDVKGNERKLLENRPATPGQSLQLTLDLDVQAAAEYALDGRRGAVIAIDPRSGEVLAMVSRPTFDPNVFAGGLSNAVWAEMLNNPDKPLLNKSIQGTYPPGSTFKPLVAMAGLETGTITPHTATLCSGGSTFYDQYFRCNATHGTVDVHRGIVQSCDVFFYTLGNKLGIDKIAEYAQLAGVGNKTGIDLPGEAQGLMPTTKWKMHTMRDRSYPGEAINASIGQGAVSITPLQLAVAIGGLAIGGEWYQPHLVKEASARPSLRKANWNGDNIQTVLSGMYGVVNEDIGTGKSARIPGISISGKTGSAQIISKTNADALAKTNKELASTFKDNGVFVGFAPSDHPEIVVVTLIEGGLHGATDAAPISAQVIRAYMEKKTRYANPKPSDTVFLQRPSDLVASIRMLGRHRE
ncbi:MAG: penicillin-binding protein 2 [Acidobacteriota bacterium]